MRHRALAAAGAPIRMSGIAVLLLLASCAAGDTNPDPSKPVVFVPLPAGAAGAFLVQRHAAAERDEE